MRRAPRSVLLGILLIGIAACFHRATGTGTDRLLITEEEIAATNAATAYDVIARLRAEYLRNRGATSLLLPSRSQPVVFMKEQEYGTIEVLRQVRSSDLSEIRFYPGPDAVTKFGSQYSGGVIQLIPRT